MSEQEQKTSFEEDLKRLEEIVTLLENGESALDESLDLFEEGQKLLNNCRKRLEQASVKISRLLDNGEPETLDLEALGRR